MNLTFSPSETIIGGDPKATTSVAGTSMSQLGAADSLKSLYTLVMSLVKKSFHFRTLLKSEKAGVQGGDLTESGGKNVYRAMKAYRFIAIVAYVSSVWAMRRAQRKALLEGAEAHFSLNTDPLSTSETIQNLFYFNKCIFINSYTLINLLSNHVRAVNVTGWRTAREVRVRRKNSVPVAP